MPGLTAFVCVFELKRDFLSPRNLKSFLCSVQSRGWGGGGNREGGLLQNLTAKEEGGGGVSKINTTNEFEN